jgi:hypothetical protein
MNQTEKIFIIIGFIFIFIYLLHYFDINDFIYIFLGICQKEPFESYLFQPNKVFQNKGKIYLLDTRRVLEINRNPLIFNSFSEYQNYIISLEKELKKNLNIKIGKKEDIPPVNFRVTNKIDESNRDPFYKNYQCQRQSAHCRLGQAEIDLEKSFKESLPEEELKKFKFKDPYFTSIFDQENLMKFQNKHCQNKLLDKEKCQGIQNMIDQTKNLDVICEGIEGRDTEYQDNFKVICDTHKFIQNNEYFLKKACAKDSTYEYNCEMEDFFRENLMGISSSDLE